MRPSATVALAFITLAAPDGLPPELTAPHPLHAHRPAGGGAREQRRVERNVVGAVVPVAAGAFRMDAADVAVAHPERLGEPGPVRKDALRMRPDAHFAVFELRERA